MAILSRYPKSDFVPCPAGTHVAVCVDVIDNGVVRTEWQGKVRESHKVTLKFETAKINPKNGLPFLVQQRYTNSLHEKSALRPLLKAWRGHDLTEEEIERGVDLETELMMRGAIISVTHNESKGNVYANIASISPLIEGMEAPKPSGKYVRVIDRPAQEPGAITDADIDALPDPDDEPLPF